MKKINIVSTLVIIIILLFVYLFVYEPQYKGSVLIEEKSLVYAHRGFGDHAPDNSLVGAIKAIENNLDGVDVDAQFSKDKEVVIFHDVSLERFTNEVGRVDSKTASELSTYDIAEKYGKGFENEFISTLDEFVKTVTPNSKLMVELKVSSIKDTGIEKRVDEILNKNSAYDKVLISSFNPFVLRRLKKTNPDIKTVLIFQDSGWDSKRVEATKKEDRVELPWFLRNEKMRTAIRKFTKPDAVSINHKVEEKVIDKLISKGYPVFIWPVNDTETINWALGKNPHGLVTDEPLLAKKLRDEFSN